MRRTAVTGLGRKYVHIGIALLFCALAANVFVGLGSSVAASTLPRNETEEFCKGALVRAGAEQAAVKLDVQASEEITRPEKGIRVGLRRILSNDYVAEFFWTSRAKPVVWGIDYFTRWQPYRGSVDYVHIETRVIKFLTERAKFSYDVVDEALYEYKKTFFSVFVDNNLLGIYSDYKSIRLAIQKGQITPERLEALLKEVGERFEASLFLKHPILKDLFDEKGVMLPRYWFSAGLGETPNDASIASRFGHASAAFRYKHRFVVRFGDVEADARQALERIEELGREFEQWSIFKQEIPWPFSIEIETEHGKARVLSPYVNTLFRKANNVDELIRIVEGRFHVKLTYVQAQELMEYWNLIQRFDKPILEKEFTESDEYHRVEGINEHLQKNDSVLLLDLVGIGGSHASQTEAYLSAIWNAAQQLDHGILQGGEDRVGYALRTVSDGLQNSYGDSQFRFDGLRAMQVDLATALGQKLAEANNGGVDSSMSHSAVSGDEVRGFYKFVPNRDVIRFLVEQDYLRLENMRGVILQTRFANGQTQSFNEHGCETAFVTAVMKTVSERIQNQNPSVWAGTRCLLEIVPLPNYQRQVNFYVNPSVKGEAAARALFKTISGTFTPETRRKIIQDVGIQRDFSEENFQFKVYFATDAPVQPGAPLFYELSPTH